MKIKDLSVFLESIAPIDLSEVYDNCGLIVGSDQTEISKALLTLDCTEEVVDEAIAENCNLIIAHHPIIFGGIKKLNGKNYVERTVIKAIKNEIAIYAIHTNLDNVLSGVNQKIAEKLHLENCKILEEKTSNLLKLHTYIPDAYLTKVQQAIFEAGAGNIGNYSDCSFIVSGKGTFKAGLDAKPFVGEKGVLQTENEMRLETVFPKRLKEKVLKALFESHPYEEVAYDLFELVNADTRIGSGIIGNLQLEMAENEFLAFLKDKMELEMIKYTSFNSRKIKKVAVCGGAGSFLLKKAIWAGADAFVSADFKYHEFFDAEKRLMIADIGHYESEKFTKTLLSELILEKFPTFALRLSKLNTNPVNYYL